MALALIRVINPKLLTHWDICDALVQISCTTPKVSHSARVCQNFSVEYNTEFKTLTQIGENVTSSMIQPKKSEPVKYVIIDNLQLVRN